MAQWERCRTALTSRACRTKSLLEGGDGTTGSDCGTCSGSSGSGSTGSVAADGGGVTRSVSFWVKRFLDVDIYAYGADPSASAAANDAAAVLAIARANDMGGVLTARIVPGLHEFSANLPPLVGAAGIDMEGSSFLASNDAQTGAFITIGSLLSGGHQSKVLRAVRVRRGYVDEDGNYAAQYSDWSDATQIGMLLRCLQNTDGDVAEIDGFTIGLRLQGEYDGTTAADCVHNKISLGRIWRCRHAVNLHSASAASAGAPNNNRFFGGDITAQTGVNTEVDRYGWSFTRADNGYNNHNTNLWIGPSFQHARPGTGVAYCVYSTVGVQQNRILDARAEWSAPSVMRGSLTMAGGGANRIQVDYATSYLRDELTDVVDGSATKAAWKTRNDRYSATANDAMREVIVVRNLRATAFADWRDGVQSTGFDDLHIAYTTAPSGGVGFATIADCVLRSDQRSALSTGQGIVVNSDSITVGASRGIGIVVDCTEAKWFFPVATQAGGARSYRWSVRCFDASGVLLGSDDRVLVDHPSLSVAWNATNLCWQVASDQTDASQAGRLAFLLPEAAAYAQIMLLYPGSDIAEVQSFGIYTTEPYPVRAFHAVAGGTRTLVGTVDWDPASVANGALTTKTMTLSGVAAYDDVRPRFSASIGNLILTGYVQGNDTPVAVLSNATGSAVNLASGTLLYEVIKPRIAGEMPPAPASFLLLEDGSSRLLLEDGVSRLVLES